MFLDKVTLVKIMKDGIELSRRLQIKPHLRLETFPHSPCTSSKFLQETILAIQNRVWHRIQQSLTENVSYYQKLFFLKSFSTLKTFYKLSVYFVSSIVASNLTFWWFSNFCSWKHVLYELRQRLSSTKLKENGKGKLIEKPPKVFSWFV